MNYQMLKSILDTLIMNFRCPVCEAAVAENNLEIIGAAGATLNLDITCPSCAKHTFVKAEISHLNIPNISALDAEGLKDLRNKLKETIQGQIREKQEFQISEKEITDLRKVLKRQHLNVEDLLN